MRAPRQQTTISLSIKQKRDLVVFHTERGDDDLSVLVSGLRKRKNRLSQREILCQFLFNLLHFDVILITACKIVTSIFLDSRLW